jgi:mRNA interferase MazF/mRNA interferase ChpB
MKSYIPEQGDIVWLDFDPSSGHEIMKRRPAFIISKKIFNQHVGLAVVAPITSTIREIKLEVVLPEKLKTAGAVLVYQFKTLDVSARQVEFIEKAPRKIIEQVTSIAQKIVSL